MWWNTEVHCGIYKIENLINHKKYIGQSINIYERWKNHIRASRRCDEEDNSLIHKALNKYGVENFSFEIIEKCEPIQNILNEREKYWIDFYNSLIEGYNLTEGGQQNGFPTRQIKDKDIILKIRERKLQGENYSDVRKDYLNITDGVFKRVWQDQAYNEIVPKNYTPENIEKAKRMSKRHISAARKNSKMTEELVLQIRTDKMNGMKRQEGYNKYKEYFTSLNGFDGIWYNKRWKDTQPVLEEDYDE